MPFAVCRLPWMFQDMKKLHHWMVGMVVAVMHTMGWCQAPSATVWMMYQNYGVSKLTSEMMANNKFAKPEQACSFVNALYSAEYWVSEFVSDREYVCNYSPAGLPSSGNSNDVKVGLFCGNGDVVPESGMCVIEGMAALARKGDHGCTTTRVVW